MKMRVWLAISGLGALLTVAPALADVVYLSDGSLLTGTVAVDQNQVTVTNVGGTVTLDRARVVSVQRGAVAGYPAASAGYGYPLGAYPAAPSSPLPLVYYGDPRLLAPPAAIPDPVSATAQPTPYDQLLQVVAASVEFRRGPGYQYAAAGTINRDDVLYRVGHTDDWYNVITRSGSAGWIPKGAAAEMGRGPDLTPYQWDFRPATPDLIVTAAVLNVRRGPGENFPVVDQLYRNDGVKTIATEGAWVRIQYLEPSSHTGWVHRNFVTDVYRHVRNLVVAARYDEATAIGPRALPALNELLTHPDWKVRYGATLVKARLLGLDQLPVQP